MSCFAVWIDRTHAKIFQFSREKMERKNLGTGAPDHHTHAWGNEDNEHLEKKLFQEVAYELSSADQILILGPGVAKHHFQNFLNEHHPLLAKKMIGCETVDHPSDPQIAAYVSKYFSNPHKVK
jgi:stalled ribosome rescue protein Dom34